MGAGDAGKRKNKILGDQWVSIPRDMNSCPAWHALAASPSALRVLWRIQEEHMAHGGYENGKLPVTYENFQAWGIRPDSIAGAIRELVALGFIEVTRRGYAGAAGVHVPSLYRLTYLPTWDAGKHQLSGTHEYRHITAADAVKIAKAARHGADERNVDRAKRNQTVAPSPAPNRLNREIQFATPQRESIPPHSVRGGPTPQREGYVATPQREGSYLYLAAKHSSHISREAKRSAAMEPALNGREPPGPTTAIVCPADGEVAAIGHNDNLGERPQGAIEPSPGPKYRAVAGSVDVQIDEDWQ